MFLNAVGPEEILYLVRKAAEVICETLPSRAMDSSIFHWERVTSRRIS
jgi:hypothetical protein